MIQQINLYRPIFRKQEKKFSARAMLQAGAVMLVGILVIYAVMQWQLARTRTELHNAERRHAEVTTQLQDVVKQFGPKTGQEANNRVGALQQEVAARQQILAALGQNTFGNHQGYSEYFLALSRQHVDGVWITGVAITGAAENVKLKGRTVEAARVPRLVQRLAGEKLLAGKEFEMFLLKDSGNSSYLDFTLKTAPGEDDKERGS